MHSNKDIKFYTAENDMPKWMCLFLLQGTLTEMLLNSLDILTFVVPPILPAALTANNAFAQKRLEKEGIYCLHSKHISLCGGIDICAFDKVIRLKKYY